MTLGKGICFAPLSGARPPFTGGEGGIPRYTGSTPRGSFFGYAVASDPRIDFAFKSIKILFPFYLDSAMSWEGEDVPPCTLAEIKKEILAFHNLEKDCATVKALQVGGPIFKVQSQE